MQNLIRHKELLLNLANLLSNNRQELARLNTIDVQTSLQTNLDNVDRGIASLKAYAQKKVSNNSKPLKGIAIYSCYGDPSFGIFGLTLAPALLAGGSKTKILIGFPHILQHYSAFINKMLLESNLLPNFEMVIGIGSFFDKAISNSDIEHAVVFGDTWVYKYVNAFKGKKSLTYYGPGNNAAVILLGCDLEKAVEKTLESAFILSGQAAVCINRCIIDSRIDRKIITQLFNEKLQQITTGKADNCYVTPIKIPILVTQVQDRIVKIMDSKTPIDNYEIQETDEGQLISPTLVWLNNIENDLWQAFHFAPVLPIVFANFNDITDIVNNTKYGIYTSIWGDINESEKWVKTISTQHIMVLKNQSILDIFSTESGYVGSWGGYKDSGFCLSAQTNWEPIPGSYNLYNTLTQTF